MSQDEAVHYWLHGSVDAWETAEKLFESKKYHFALFFCHLATEKILKACITQMGQTAPPIHNLPRLAEHIGLSLDNECGTWLEEISGFNLDARYDDYKLAFYKKATKEYCQLWMGRTEEIILWIKKNCPLPYSK